MRDLMFKGIALIILLVLVNDCSNDQNITGHDSNYDERIEVILNDIPFQTEKYLRIPYSLKMWEYEKENLVLEQIMILDNENVELMIINKEDFPTIYKNPLDPNPYLTQDEISSYYISIQLPIPLAGDRPEEIYHRLTLRDSLLNEDLIIEGAPFIPRYNESPLVIASPVKGSNWVFVNQSTMGYHFYVLFFVGGEIFKGERFAFDNLQLNDDFMSWYNGDPKDNNSYFNYTDTLYAVADGVVKTITDGRPENNGDAQDIIFNSLDEYCGNYMIIDIGGGLYAFYVHCVPYKFMVSVGDTVQEGDKLALLGNSGNSTAPHLHFHIADSPELLLSNCVPFVFKSFTVIGEFGTGPVSPVQITNSMMEENTVVSFE
ncbi:MAG: hypothetical protein A2V66_10495 [Ignavibacteria bacterium RBG_13_36_8]|nr:MAG: hypothetical protein A2V66_10495 [Ignavibacteria bacterium RBG_13_36_8]